MKKFTVILLIASLITSLASCGGSEAATTTTTSGKTTTTTTTATEGTTTPETTTSEETTTTEATTTTSEETTTTPEATTTTTVPETTTTTTAPTTTTTTAATTKPATTTKVTTTTTKPVTTTKVTTTAPKTEPTTTTTPAPTYDHCEGFNKIWGENGAPYYDEMKQYGELYGGGDPFSRTTYCEFERITAYAFGMKLDQIDFIKFKESETSDNYYCREVTILVTETADGQAVTLESAKEMLSDLYGPAEQNADSNGNIKYCWYNTADGDITLSVRNYSPYKTEIEIKEAGWKFVLPEGWLP